ncbi:MAG: hypothetical protein ACL93V_05860 [Candidatus Electrothrix sp. YB6]
MKGEHNRFGSIGFAVICAVVDDKTDLISSGKISNEAGSFCSRVVKLGRTVCRDRSDAPEIRLEDLMQLETEPS